MSNTERYENVLDAFEDVLDEDDTKQVIDDLKKQIKSREVVNLLTSLRAANDLTQSDIAKSIGCTQAKISRIENGYDADVRLSDIEGYARASNSEVTLLISERGMNLSEQIKHHAFAMRSAFLKLAELSHTDPAIAKGVAELHVQAFHNINRFLQESAEKLPVSPDNGEHYIQIAATDVTDETGQKKKRVAALKGQADCGQQDEVLV